MSIPHKSPHKLPDKSRCLECEIKNLKRRVFIVERENNHLLQQLLDRDVELSNLRSELTIMTVQLNTYRNQIKIDNNQSPC